MLLDVGGNYVFFSLMMMLLDFWLIMLIVSEPPSTLNRINILVLWVCENKNVFVFIVFLFFFNVFNIEEKK